jgi:hypothetical protein
MADRKHKTISHRLGRLGLADRHGELRNFIVEPRAEVHIHRDDRTYAGRIAVLNIRSARDLKRCLGVPEGAIGQTSPAPAHSAGFVSASRALPFLNVPAVPLKDAELRARLTWYMMSNSTAETATSTEKALQSQLDIALIEAFAHLAVFLALDIHVGQGATLVFHKSMSTLFANRITMEEGATIRMEAPFAQIDCASIKYDTGVYTIGSENPVISLEKN